MIKLIIFFRKPADVEAFEEHFANQHVPLIAAMPNVYRSSVSRALGSPRGEPPYHLIHDVYFADMAALNYALNSPEGRAAGADLMSFARDVVSLMFAEVWGEDPFEMGVGAELAPQPAQDEQPPHVNVDAEPDHVIVAEAPVVEAPVVEAPVVAPASDQPPAIPQTDTPVPGHPHPPQPSLEEKLE
jgi:uncharacterized protein (TIGR02118 family)